MDIQALISQMTLEEKAGLCSGLDFWHTKPVERLGVPAVMVSDGPHGLRKQDLNADHLGMNESIKAVCMPAACATAASFDRELIGEMGRAIGRSCQHEQLSVVLGPAVNIKRSPLCGRNFEYFSEDPYLAGEISAAFIAGVQSQNVGTSIKHFAANNQEHRRMSSSSNIDERTLREIYLPAFEISVKKSQPWTVMCSYNRLNGTYASEHPWLLTEVLRNEWGFEGYVMSDWGAVSNRVAGLAAGLDLEMPASGGINDAKIVEAVRAGRLDEAVLDRAVERILTVNYRYLENAKPETPWDKEADHLLSARIAGECMVLLKNEDSILPLNREDSVAFIGEFAEKPRFQGGGSSHINSFRKTSALEAAEGLKVTYARGYDAAADETTDALIAEAVDAARKARVAVVFAGLPDAYESEGYDRSHMRLPECQNKLIEAVAQANPNTVVVLHNGSPVEMPWLPRVKAVLEAYLGGQAVGIATVRVLYGDVNPSGHLAETFPVKLSDNPSYLFYGGEGNEADYREGVFVGYRYYDRKEMEVLFPFGHGLSYTTFAYSNLRLSKEHITDQDTLTATVTVTNTGSRAGKTVVQLYVGDPVSSVFRPVRELKGFEKVELQPGESKEVTFTLGKRAFAYWNTQLHDWYVESGDFTIEIGQSSRHIDVSATVQVDSTARLPRHYTMDSIVMDIMADPRAAAAVQPLVNVVMGSLNPGDGQGSDAAREAISEDMNLAMIQYMPLRGVLSFGGGVIDPAAIQALLDSLNS
ncbi:MAG: glycoside hydrolase family 3 C-terminal domain-containing protein [Candidatus Faecousia sp.]|nr:glycoside hydrolase family 3 C-terminal domain-containing protein [Clostridiales bacterium]MDY6181413.1 glycoside hydrolase family 3 C-terminal domain-containing protein [Candidatus Faecousia sp.]